MTYVKRPRVRVRHRAALGDFYEPFNPTGTPFTDPTSPAECLETANERVAPFDAKIDDLVRNWNPTGFYTSSDVRTIVAGVMENVRAAQSALDQARAEPNASQETALRVTSDLARVGERSIPYLEAAAEADSKGVRVLDIPGLKRWVTDSLATTSSSMVAATVIGCIRPWWVGALAWFQSTFDTVYGVVREIAGTVVEAGEAVLEVLPLLPSVLKWGLLAVVGYLVWSEMDLFMQHGHEHVRRRLRQGAGATWRGATRRISDRSGDQ